MASMMLRRHAPDQLMLDLGISHGTSFMVARWRGASENDKKSGARFAQNAMKPKVVAPPSRSSPASHFMETKSS
jgi:hypothetical protein